MENKPTVLQIGIKYGIISGIIGVLYTVILYVIGEAMNMWIASIGFLFLIALMVFGMKEYKNEHNGFLEYKEGLGIGTIIVVVSSLISQVFNFIYMNYLDTSVFAQVEEKTREMFEKMGMDEDQIEKATIDSQERMSSPLSILWGVIFSVVIGFIISLIIAAIMQKKRSELDTIDVG